VTRSAAAPPQSGVRRHGDGDELRPPSTTSKQCSSAASAASVAPTARSAVQAAGWRADTIPAGIPRDGKVLLVLSPQPGAPVPGAQSGGPPPTRSARCIPRQAGLVRRTHGSRDATGQRRCCGCPAKRMARGAFSCPRAGTCRCRTVRWRRMRLRRSHQRRSACQRANPCPRSPARRAEGGADRDRLGERGTQASPGSRP
jgi:hypothetical protein